MSSFYTNIFPAGDWFANPAKPAKRCQDLKAEKFQKNNPGKRAQQSRPS